MKYFCPYDNYFRQYTESDWDACPNCGYRPEAYMVTPGAIKPYIGKNITTRIKGYGRVRAYVIGYNPGTEMASLVLLTPSGQNYIEVHYSDMTGIAPDFGGQQGGVQDNKGNKGQKNKSYYDDDDNDYDDDDDDDRKKKPKGKKKPGKKPGKKSPHDDWWPHHPKPPHDDWWPHHPKPSHDNWHNDGQRQEGWYPPRWDEYGYNSGGWWNQDGWIRDKIDENSDEWLSLDKLQKDS